MFRLPLMTHLSVNQIVAFIGFYFLMFSSLISCQSKNDYYKCAHCYMLLKLNDDVNHSRNYHCSKTKPFASRWFQKLSISNYINQAILTIKL